MATKKPSRESTKSVRRETPAKRTKEPASPNDALKPAVLGAWDGDMVAARPVIEDLAKQGNVPACAAFAVILAFEGELGAMIPFAGALLRQNLAVATRRAILNR